ncbi:uncharacterized protein BJX67DRAFT_348368 [Aspergillus lucknowensis]|uniref:PPM-type phosphatase domain-containing protein n=1 Tax=Aspergillus lucknowensis TaxID=176173 RepID=A0ABR4LWP9_9EURO
MSMALGDLEYKQGLNSITTGAVGDEKHSDMDDPTEGRGDFISTQMSFSRVDLKKDEDYILALTSDGLTNAMEDNVIMQSRVHLFSAGLD